MRPKTDDWYVIEEPGMPSWPVRLGAAGWRDMNSLPRPMVDAFRQELRVLLRRDRTGSIAEFAVEIEEASRDGDITARYDFRGSRRWATPSAPYYTINGEETTPPERVRKRLNLDRHRERARDLMLWACEFDRELGPSVAALSELAEVVARTRWSRRGPVQVIDDNELKDKRERGLSLNDQALEFGVEPASIRRHDNRRRQSR